MALVADLHCHTTASGHAYSTVTEIAAQAAALGQTGEGDKAFDPRCLGRIGGEGQLLAGDAEDLRLGRVVVAHAEGRHLFGDLDFPAGEFESFR